jgi:hypothetical protein
VLRISDIRICGGAEEWISCIELIRWVGPN